MASGEGVYDLFGAGAVMEELDGIVFGIAVFIVMLWFTGAIG